MSLQSAAANMRGFWSMMQMAPTLCPLEATSGEVRYDWVPALWCLFPEKRASHPRSLTAMAIGWGGSRVQGHMATSQGTSLSSVGSPLHTQLLIHTSRAPSKVTHATGASQHLQITLSRRPSSAQGVASMKDMVSMVAKRSSLLGGRGGQLGIGTISAPGFVSEGCSSEEPSLMLGALAVEEVWVRNDDVLDGTPFAVVCLMPTLQYSPLPIRCETAAWCCCESVLSAIEGLRAASDSSTACSLALFFLDAALDHPPVALRHGGPPLVALIFTPGLKLMSHEILFGWQQDAGDCSPAWPFGTSFSLRCCSTSCSSRRALPELAQFPIPKWDQLRHPTVRGAVKCFSTHCLTCWHG
mmetsp:Transcript_6273/g.16664  ORF Transcript_6273/g.16664 Transcript_6273/m.16664 type:complete len:355 (-) Transcript_6273:27-1091(-)